MISHSQSSIGLGSMPRLSNVLAPAETTCRAERAISVEPIVQVPLSPLGLFLRCIEGRGAGRRLREMISHSYIIPKRRAASGRRGKATACCRGKGVPSTRRGARIAAAPKGRMTSMPKRRRGAKRIEGAQGARWPSRSPSRTVLEPVLLVSTQSTPCGWNTAGSKHPILTPNLDRVARHPRVGQLLHEEPCIDLVRVCVCECVGVCVCVCE